MATDCVLAVAYAAIQLNADLHAPQETAGVKQKRPTKRGFVAGEGLGLPPPSLREAQPGPNDRASESLLRCSLRACDAAVTTVPFLTPAQPSDALLPGPSGALKRPRRFPVQIGFLWCFCNGPQGAYHAKAAVLGPGSGELFDDVGSRPLRAAASASAEELVARMKDGARRRLLEAQRVVRTLCAALAEAHGARCRAVVGPKHNTTSRDL